MTDTIEEWRDISRYTAHGYKWKYKEDTYGN